MCPPFVIVLASITVNFYRDFGFLPSISVNHSKAFSVIDGTKKYPLFGFILLLGVRVGVDFW